MPPIPAPFDQLGSARFSFYPPIANIEHNEWMFRSAEWDEIRVVNTKTSEEIWVPRRFLGAVSLGRPVVIVGLLKELEYKQGAVLPTVRRVIEMPRAVNESPRPRIRAARPQTPAAVVGIRLEPRRSRSRLALGAIAAGMLLLIPVGILVRDGFLGSRQPLLAPVMVDLPFTVLDDYASIAARIGPPAQDRTRTSRGVEYRWLTYPSRGFTLLLRDGFYAGALDPSGRVIHLVRSIQK